MQRVLSRLQRTETGRSGRLSARSLTRLTAALVAGLVAVVLSGCAPNYTYLTSVSSQTYLKVPHAWRVYDQKAIEAKEPVKGQAFPYLAIFDANSKPSLDHLLTPTSQPWGVLQVSDIDPSDQVSFSLDSLTNEVIQVDQLSQTGQVQVVGSPALLSHGSFRGIQEELELQAGKQTLVAEQVGYTNDTTSRAWVLLVGCSANCFNQNHAEITRLVQSWIVGKS